MDMKHKYKPDPDKLHPSPEQQNTYYLKNLISNPNIIIGDFTYYYDLKDASNFEAEHVLYHYPCNKDKLIIGKFCSIACRARFIFNGANHKMNSFSTYPFPVFSEIWDKYDTMNVTEAWDNKGDIVIGNDVWIGYEAVIMSGVHIGDGAIIGTRALVTKDVPPYTIVGGVPAHIIRKRFDDEVIEVLLKAKWWDWDIEKIRDNLSVIRSGDIDKFRGTFTEKIELRK